MSSVSASRVRCLSQLILFLLVSPSFSEKRGTHDILVTKVGNNSLQATGTTPSPPSSDAPPTYASFPIAPVIIAVCGGVVLIMCIAGFSLLWWHQAEARRRRLLTPLALQQGECMSSSVRNIWFYHSKPYIVCCSSCCRLYI